MNLEYAASEPRQASRLGVSVMNLEICHLYPEIMNLYGDRGNVIALNVGPNGMALTLG
jgi:hypothetical protein